MPSSASLSLSKPASASLLLQRAIAARSLSPPPPPPRSSCRPVSSAPTRSGANALYVPNRLIHSSSSASTTPTSMVTSPTTASATASSSMTTMCMLASSSSSATPLPSSSISRQKHAKSKSLLNPAPSSASTLSSITERVPRPLTNSSPSFAQPIANSYWATPYLIACEYPWSPPCAAYKSLNGNGYPKIDLRCPSLVKLLALVRTGVRTFIDLTAPSDALCPYSPFLPALSAALTAATGEEIQLAYHRVPIEDRALPSPAAISTLLTLLTSLEANAKLNSSILPPSPLNTKPNLPSPSTAPRKPPALTAIHCRGGIGRTGTVVGCYLIHSGRVRTGADALRVVNAEWAFVEKKKRYPESPETGAQWEYVRSFVMGKTKVISEGAGMEADRIMGTITSSCGKREEVGVGNRSPGAKW